MLQKLTLKSRKISDYASGRFIIGLRDDLENEDTDDEEPVPTNVDQPQEAESTNKRTFLRTMHLRMADSATISGDGGML